ncbi:glycosyltransferase family 4 protein [bacterium]|nr:glycosyltransferase family 4 protein [bacterium]
MKRIAINLFASHKIQTGIGTYLTGLIEGLSKIKLEFEPVLILNTEGCEIFSPYLDRFEHFHAPSITDTVKGRVFYEHTIFKKALKKLEIDLLHSPVFVTPINYKGPGILTIHDTTFITHPQYHVPSKRFYFKNGIPMSVKKNQKVIAISENTKRDLIELFPKSKEKFVYIPYGVSSIFYSDISNTEKVEFKRKYELPEKFLLYVGVLEPRKNLESTIEAFAKADIPKDVSLVLAGTKGWYYKDIFKTITELGLEDRITHIGHIEYRHLPHLYRRAIGFLYPSLYEGFGMPVIEAMASGCPVLTSDISSTKEVAGNSAMLVDPHSNDDIIRGIEMLVNDEKRVNELVKMGRTRADEFTWEKNARRTQRVIMEVLNGT